MPAAIIAFYIKIDRSANTLFADNNAASNTNLFGYIQYFFYQFAMSFGYYTFKMVYKKGVTCNENCVNFEINLDAEISI